MPEPVIERYVEMKHAIRERLADRHRGMPPVEESDDVRRRVAAYHERPTHGAIGPAGGRRVASGPDA
jgi:Mg-chelatase subunit ChlI